MYLNYHPTNDFPINLENIVDLIGFANKANAKRSLTNNFTVNEDYKILLLPKDDHRWGGNNDETIMLNTDTFKNLYMIVKTEKAKNIRKYYIKLEKIVNMVNNEDLEEEKEKQKLIENELRLQLEQNNKQKKLLENDNQKLIKEKELERQNILLQQFSHECNLVYIIKIKTFDDGTYVIKIGESRQGINNRFKKHQSNYEECLLLDCFLVDKCNSFEKFLHDELYESRLKDLYGHEKELELFLIGEKLTYRKVKNLIYTNIDLYNNISKVSLELEQSKINSKNLELLLEAFNSDDCKGLLQFNKFLGFNCQYDINNNLVKEFTSRTNCCYEMSMCLKTLNLLLKNGTIYKDFTYKILPEKVQMINKNLI